MRTSSAHITDIEIVSVLNVVDIIRAHRRLIGIIVNDEIRDFRVVAQQCTTCICVENIRSILYANCSLSGDLHINKGRVYRDWGCFCANRRRGLQCHAVRLINGIGQATIVTNCARAVAVIISRNRDRVAAIRIVNIGIGIDLA